MGMCPLQEATKLLSLSVTPATQQRGQLVQSGIDAVTFLLLQG